MENEVDKLASELYYDLKEKYILLVAELEKEKRKRKNTQVQLATYKEFTTIDPKVIAKYHNERISMCQSLVSKNLVNRGNTKDLIDMMRSLKIRYNYPDQDIPVNEEF